MNERGNETAFVELKEGGDKEKLEVALRQSANDQVSFTHSVTTATDPCPVVCSGAPACKKSSYISCGTRAFYHVCPLEGKLRGHFIMFNPRGHFCNVLLVV